MPRIARPSKPPAAHPAAEAAAAAHQAKPPQTHSGSEKQTKSSTTSNRNTRMTPFKPGFEEDTEHELADAFKRPPRYFKEDPPFYPWLPCVPKVQFKLNFKG